MRKADELNRIFSICTGVAKKVEDKDRFLVGGSAKAESFAFAAVTGR